MVNYEKSSGFAFDSFAKNVVKGESIKKKNCAADCFNKAGCSAFFIQDDICNYVIGRTFGAIRNSKVTSGGQLDNICPANPFKNSFVKKSEFKAYIFAPTEADDIADNIVEANTGRTDIQLRSWSFEDQSKDPWTTSSQYVDVVMRDLEGHDLKIRYRVVSFHIETHFRIEQDENGRARRSTEDIIAQIDALEEKVSSLILDGGLQMPEGAEVVATSPIETLEFVQTAADGSDAADCSSGSCQCSDGFEYINNNCEMSAATTTAAPTTTTQAVISDSVRDWFTSLVDNKMKTVFEAQRPDGPRPHLMKKWKNFSEKFVNRYKSMVNKGCEFPDTYEDATVNFYSTIVCYVSPNFNSYFRQNKIYR